ncbi:MAG: hypothetical protein JXA44_08140 [Methanospirillaceae archaeon]|nr:hypothetical protein [Methanospirillaceae archaeon]
MVIRLAEHRYQVNTGVISVVIHVKTSVKTDFLFWYPVTRDLFTGKGNFCSDSKKPDTCDA